MPIATGCHARTFDHRNQISLWVGPLQGTKVAVQMVKRDVDNLLHHFCGRHVANGRSVRSRSQRQGTGTLRYLLVAPVSRARLLLIKFFGASAFALAATFTLMLTGIIIGAILFPIGPVTLLSGDVISIPAALLRILLVALYVTISLMGLTAIGLFISTLTVIPVGAMAATVVVSTVTQILGTLPQLSVIHPYLISYYWLGFADLLRNPMSLESFASNTFLQLAYIAIFGSLAYGRFTTKDVLS